jgi:hypothetical protein
MAIHTLTQPVFNFDAGTTFTSFNYNDFVIENNFQDDPDIMPPMCVNCDDDVIDGFVDSEYDESHCVKCFTTHILAFTK